MKFTVADTAYNLKYTVNAMAELEEYIGKSFTDILVSGEFAGLRAMLYAGLVEDNPSCTLKQAGDLMGAYMAEGHDLIEVSNLVTEALKQAGFFHQGRKMQSPGKRKA